MAGIIERLSEGVVNRDMRAEGHALLAKWERTGLLEGLENDRKKNSMGPTNVSQRLDDANIVVLNPPGTDVMNRTNLVNYRRP